MHLNESFLQGSFRITAENVPCGAEGLACTKSVKLYIHDTIIHMVRGTDPIVSKNTAVAIGTPKAQYTIKEAGLFVYAETPYGITVQWDKSMRVYVTLEPEYMGKVCGLCGNFDNKAENDFRARSGQIEEKALTFAESWKTSTSCPATSDPKDPCSINPEREYWSKYACEVLRSASFKDCHSVVSSTHIDV